ncbi:ion transporter [Waterburya agarophytonicola K14]|uniref:Ion transporter n=1 Tax=Waterburya agarophytonicola KI4 TaxID=2874699 RepID=A0A964BNJ9_9CYAN|nr:ion transporter [Waterburya agarophytonicola]MCC0175987.1 ion transporter [Waterburya agarophytonicola KI4]
MKRRAFQRKLYHVLEDTRYSSWLGKLDQILLFILIVLDISSFILETSFQLNQQYYWFFKTVAIFSTIIFSLEYGLRLWLCTFERRFRHPFWGRLHYAVTPMAIIDFISTFPFYLILVFHNLAFLKTLRLLRLARILKIGRHSKALRSLAQVVIRKQEELLITFSTIFFLLIIASSLMFFAEHDAQPEAFSSIPAAMWWGAVTLTTVGYGDIYPVTVIGKLLGASLAFFGIGVFVLPAGIVASGFAEEVKYGINPEEDPIIETMETKHSHLSLKKLEITKQYQQVQADAKLLRYCLEIARQELADTETNPEAIDSWAMFLYIRAKQDR